MTNMTPYLHFMGNTEEAMRFYKSVFGGEYTIFARFGDTPGAEKMSLEERQKIIHISLEISKGLTLMATDMLASMEQQVVAGNNYHVCLHTESEKETERLFEELSKGGTVEMPLNKTFFATSFGMCRDKFGVQWMISYFVPPAKI